MTLKWLSGVHDKTKQYYCCFFFFFSKMLFNYVIQEKFFAWLVNSALNCTWKPISPSSLRDSCDIGFRVQFNAEFPRQVMNFSIELLPVSEVRGQALFFNPLHGLLVLVRGSKILVTWCHFGCSQPKWHHVIIDLQTPEPQKYCHVTRFFEPRTKTDGLWSSLKKSPCPWTSEMDSNLIIITILVIPVNQILSPSSWSIFCTFDVTESHHWDIMLQCYTTLIITWEDKGKLAVYCNNEAESSFMEVL